MQSMTIGSAVADIGSQISDNAFGGMQAGANAANVLTSLLPAGAEEVSAQAVAAFTNEAAQMLALNQAAQQELMRVGSAIGDIARMYSDVDVAAADSVVGIGLQLSARMSGV
ncbi:PE family protein [Mycobacterium sp. ML4]